MQPHPASIDHNYVNQFPEIFRKYEPIRFMLPNRRMDDFLAAAGFLYGSKANEDINMVFSAVQRLTGYKHIDFIDYILDSKIGSRLLNVSNINELAKSLEEIKKEFNEKYGMKKPITNFYQKFLHYAEKHKLIGKFSKPAYYKNTHFENDNKRTKNTSLKFVIEWLITMRNKLDHDAIYIPFYKVGQPYEATIRFEDKNKKIEIHHTLTFIEFYEFTRKAMARFWLKEYERYLKEGGKQIVDEIIHELNLHCDEINQNFR